MRYSAFGRSSALAWVAATATLALAAGGVALASASHHRDDFVIHGCANKTTGVLRVAARCLPGEKVIIWNQFGPAGPAGAVSATYSTLSGTPDDDQDDACVDNTSTPQCELGLTPVILLSAPLGPGKYTANATLDGLMTDTGALSVTCTLALPGGGGSYTDTVTVDDSVNQAEVPLDLSVNGTVAASGNMTLTCQETGLGGDPIQVNQAVETATRVGTLNFFPS